MTLEANPPCRVKALAPLRRRDFRWLWAGMASSLLGDGVFLVAMAWQVYLLSGAPAALAAAGIALSLPQVLLLVTGGVASDRFERRRLLIAGNLVAGGAIGAVAALALTGNLTLPSMLALMVLYGATNAFAGPAFEAIVPDLVPRAQLTEANALDQFVRPVALRLIGPALGGLILAAVGTGPAFVLDAASFVAAAGCVARIARRPAQRRAPSAAGRPLDDVRAGLAFVRGHAWLWGTLVGATASYLLFVGPAEVLLPFVVKNDLHAGPTVLGLVLAAGGVGALFAAALAGQHGMPRRHMTLMYASWSLATLAIAGYGLAASSWQLALASVLFNGLEAAGTVWWATTKHRLVPPDLRGRVSSLDWFVSVALVPASYAFTAPVAAAVGARDTLIAVGVVGSLTTLAPLIVPGLRDVERDGLALDGGDLHPRVEAVAS